LPFGSLIVSVVLQNGQVVALSVIVNVVWSLPDDGAVFGFVASAEGGPKANRNTATVATSLRMNVVRQVFGMDSSLPI
jgi:hypothetical protein